METPDILARVAIFFLKLIDEAITAFLP